VEQRLTGAGTADGGAALMSGRDGGAIGEAAVGTWSAGRRSGHGGVECGAAVETRRRGATVGRDAGGCWARRGVRGGSSRDARRAVPIATLRRAVGVAHGGHAAAARGG
jgi:hypothetical protein